MGNGEFNMYRIAVMKAFWKLVSHNLGILTLLNCTLKMVKIINFTLYVLITLK